MATAEATIRLRELIGDARVAMATTTTPAGELHSRPLSIGAVDDDGAIRFLVDGTAAWVLGLRHGDPINLAVADDDDGLWVSIAGTAGVTEDRATAHRLWTDDADRFFPAGLASPELRVLEVEPTTAEYWDAPSSRLQQLTIKAGSLIGRTGPTGESGSIDLA